MLDNLQTINVFSPSIADVLINISVSLICSFAISLIYRFTYRGPGYSESFVDSIVFLSVITTIVIMIIGNNLARAFGLVGALSIIRFRTAIKDTIDIVYIFLALAIGMAGGVGYHKLAVTGTGVIGVIFILFSFKKSPLFLSRPYMLQFVCSQCESHKNSSKEILYSYCRSFELINIRSNEINESLEYSYYIHVKRNKDTDDLVQDLKRVEGMKSINLFFDQQNL
ncbi:MAG: DUF4956 domain-containing protein [Bacteroidota bacterium]